MASLFSFYIRNLDFKNLSDMLEKFVLENQPTEEEETNGFIDFNKTSEYISFKYYERSIIRKMDPARKTEISIPIIGTTIIGLSKKPQILMIFTSHPKKRDRILSSLPISEDNRYGIEFSGDFIETLNKMDEKHKWFKQIMDDDIENVGRHGFEPDSPDHKIVEQYGDPKKRLPDIDRKMVFRLSAILSVALKDVTYKLRLYQTGKITIYKLKTVDLEKSIPFISDAINKLYERYIIYQKLSGKLGR